MAIDRMLRATFLVPRGRAGDLVRLLQQRQLVHFTPLAADGGRSDGLGRVEVSLDAVEARLKHLALVERVFDQFSPARRGFLASMVSLPLRVSEEEQRRIVQEFDPTPLLEECQGLAEDYAELTKDIEEAESQADALGFFAQLPSALADVRALNWMRVWVGSLSARNWDDLQADDWAAEHLAFQELGRGRRTVNVCVAAARSEAQQVPAVLRRYEFVERPLPAPGVPVEERIAALRRKAQAMRRLQQTDRARVEALSVQRRPVAVLRAHLEAERARLRALGGGAASKRLSVFTGYVRAADAPALEEMLPGSVPGASVLLERPRSDERVPVSLRLGPVLKPMASLVRMFGLPDYFSFDPTPYLSLSFLIFFGFCFGDVVYGAMLCAVAGYLAWKARRYGGPRDFCMLFLYGGISTMLAGAVTGSWAADLWQPQYLGEGNFLLRLKESAALIDPLERPVAILLVALGVGIANQFYGIALKGYGLLRRGKPWDALFDAGLWLVALPGFLLVASKLFMDVPDWLFRTGLVLLAVGGAGLVLTQGRGERTLGARLMTGVVSLYGILGSYGCMAFVGDMLSYSRLLALGLTTTIVGMSFNIIAGLVRGVPHVGVVLFVLVIVAGHTFNFAISILGSFVHSARLVFLEFFGRFYEANGVPFRPLSLSTERVLVGGSWASRMDTQRKERLGDVR